jgi:hypothetical protein
MSTAPLSGVGEALSAPARKTIPFDFAFRYELTGKPGTVRRNVVTVSIEAAFVAVSIGYGVVPTVETITFGPPPSGTTDKVSLRSITFGDVIDGLSQTLGDVIPRQVGPQVASVLANGIKLSDVLRSSALLGGGTSALDADATGSLFQAVAAPADRVQFRYALFDDATGREFQSEPILNIAGLGIADGDRPFRYFARPIRFAPRSTIRLEITEESEFVGELHVALQGYKILGGASSPTGRAVRRAARHLGR